MCIRNAFIHNGSDLAKNKDPMSVAKVTAANIQGLDIVNGSIFSLRSDERVDFMKTPRLVLVAVAHYHGDG